MSQQTEQSGGAIFSNDYKQNDNQPDWTGKLEITSDLIKDLTDLVDSGNVIGLNIALWNRTSKNGKDYKYARLSIPQAKPETNGSPSDQFDNGDMPF